MNSVVSSRTGAPLAVTVRAGGPTGFAAMHGRGTPAGVTKGHGGTNGTARSIIVTTGAPPTSTVGAVAGTILNAPPWLHVRMAFSLSIGGTARSYGGCFGPQGHGNCPKVRTSLPSQAAARVARSSTPCIARTNAALPLPPGCPFGQRGMHTRLSRVTGPRRGGSARMRVGDKRG